MISVKTNSATEMAKELSCGIFWCIAESEEQLTEKNLLPFMKGCSLEGIPVDTEGFNAKSGMTYNHKETWSTLPSSVTHSKKFDYYPRGRVEIRNNKATIWLNQYIAHLAKDIAKLYGLSALSNVQTRVDGSEHYKCHFDE